MKKLFFICVFLISAFGFAQNEQLFEEGKKAYEAESYQKAIDSWKRIIDNGKESSNLYFNLANAHYKMNHVGPSIYYYEKALQLTPNNNDVKTNLAFAENARIDAIEPLPKTIFAKWYSNIAGIFNYGDWAIISVTCSFLFVAFFLFYYFSASERKKRILFTMTLLFFICLIISVVMAFQTYKYVQMDRPAILFAETAIVKSEPNLGSEDVFTLHEGTKVQIIETDNKWVRITLLDGRDGWLPKNDLKEL